jgi:uncharacterized hydrophobic protein (TIGR00341 family)
MRLLQISVRDDRLDGVLEVLRERQFGYTVSDGAADQADRTNVSFVVPADAVEYVLEDLEDEGFDMTEFTVSLNTEFAHFEDVDEVQNRWGKSPNRLAPAALRSKAKDLRRNTRSYLWMMVLSAIVATAGLFLSSPAVVVGSMVIAPIVSPVLTADVGIVRNDRDMLIESLHMQLFGLAVATVAAAVVAWLIRELHVVPLTLSIEQMELVGLRISPSILAVVIGVTAGAAGAYGLATKGQVTIVGVMIAAALIPTAAATGIGIAWGNPVVAVGSLLLLVVSIIGVNVGGAVMLLYLGYRPDEVDESLFTFDSARRALVVVATLLVVAGLVAVTGVTFAQQSAFERSVNDAVTDVLSQEEYRALGVRAITIEYTAPSFTDRTVVTITLTRTTGEEFPELPNLFAETITDRTDRDVVVQVQYVDYDRSDVSEARSVRSATVGDSDPSRSPEPVGRGISGTLQ